MDDSLWTSELEELPDGSFIFIGEIKKAFEGDDFSLFPVENKKSIKIDGVLPEVFGHYMSIFNNCENFGLPSGKGWISEQQWLLELLMELKMKKSEIELWHATR